MKVGIFSPSLVTGDAMSNDTVSMYRILKTQGIDTYIFANHSTIPNLPIHNPYEAVTVLKEPSDVLIYQHGCGYFNAVLILNALPCRKIVKYHNVTPAEFFYDNPIALSSSQEGIKQTHVLLRTIPEFWVASEYSGLDLSRMGKALYSVIPPFHQIQDLVESQEDKPLFDKSKLNVVMVGRVVPHKNIEAGLEMIAKYKKSYGPDIRLIVVGSLDFGAHITRLKNLIKRLDLEDDVYLVGKVSTPQLKAIYKLSDIMLITSRHEGFCVPLVEAMAFGLPVISNTETALPYTGGDAVIYVPEYEHQLGADAMHKLRTDSGYSGSYRKKALLRYQSHFTNTMIEKRFLDLLFFPSIKNEVPTRSSHYTEPHVTLVQLIHRLEKATVEKSAHSTKSKLALLASYLNPKKMYRRLCFGDEISQETVKMVNRLLIAQVNDYCDVVSELQQLKNEIQELKSKS